MSTKFTLYGQDLLVNEIKMHVLLYAKKKTPLKQYDKIIISWRFDGWHSSCNMI